MESNKKESIGAFLKYGSIGIEMGLCVVIGIVMGFYLDKWFGTSPYLTVTFLLFGIAAAFKVIIVLIRKVAQDDERSDGK